MNFGVAIIQQHQAFASSPAVLDTAQLAPPAPLAPRTQRLASTCFGKRYDCGKHGTLSVKEIADIAGTSKTAVYNRLRADVSGEALCAPRWSRQSEIRRESPPRRHTLVAAFRLAALFADRVPTIEEIQAFRPMSRQNAQCWRQAIATAREASR